MKSFRIIFVLPSRGGGGGANSVVQETLALARLGVGCVIAVNQLNLPAFQSSYPELAASPVAIAGFSDASALSGIFAEADIACATTAMSVRTVAEALNLIPQGRRRPRTAYYVQDYEPLFFELSSPEWHEARASYAALPEALLFAKTRWLCQVVESNHGVPVSLVRPSIDHSIFFPDLARESGVLRIAAMLRPRTPRRAPFRTLRILDWILREHGEIATVEVFGTPDDELKRLVLELPPGAINLGHLRRTEVPALLRRSDLFLDLSDYQAFGRTAPEAMASGCVPVVPVFGGTAEFARHGWNSFAVDTRSDIAIQGAVNAFLRSTPAERATLRLNGLLTAADYSSHRAALSEFAVLSKLVERS